MVDGLFVDNRATLIWGKLNAQKQKNKTFSTSVFFIMATEQQNQTLSKILGLVS